MHYYISTISVLCFFLLTLCTLQCLVCSLFACKVAFPCLNWNKPWVGLSRDVVTPWNSFWKRCHRVNTPPHLAFLSALLELKYNLPYFFLFCTHTFFVGHSLARQLEVWFFVLSFICIVLSLLQTALPLRSKCTGFQVSFFLCHPRRWSSRILIARF